MPRRGGTAKKLMTCDQKLNKSILISSLPSLPPYFIFSRCFCFPSMPYTLLNAHLPWCLTKIANVAVMLVKIYWPSGWSAFAASSLSLFWTLNAITCPSITPILSIHDAQIDFSSFLDFDNLINPKILFYWHRKGIKSTCFCIEFYLKSI